MATAQKDPVLVVLQLNGGNDYMNTVVPFNDPHYYDNRPKLGVDEGNVLKLNDEVGLHPTMGPLRDMYKDGDMAILNGIGWAGSNRSHFRCMDIWHTAEPDYFATEGWLGKATRQLDPHGENPVTTVNIGHGLPRALVADGVSVASVADIGAYGLLTAVEEAQRRQRMLDHFAKMYAPVSGRGAVVDYVAQTGMDALNGADMIKLAPKRYESQVEYGSNPIAKNLRDVAQVHLAGLGTRVLYTEYGGFDTHAAQATAHPKLWTDVSTAVADFWDDLRAHDAADNVTMLVFSEFGRRVKENGGGTDHGAAGVAFAIGPNVNGGIYGDYPEIRAEALVDGDLAPTQDFRGLYSTLLGDWMGIDEREVMPREFEKPAIISSAAHS
jgi:uncharacterized protein (DUF1501 family)